jgi:hypothetical protein
LPIGENSAAAVIAKTIVLQSLDDPTPVLLPPVTLRRVAGRHVHRLFENVTQNGQTVHFGILTSREEPVFPLLRVR